MMDSRLFVAEEDAKRLDVFLSEPDGGDPLPHQKADRRGQG